MGNVLFNVPRAGMEMNGAFWDNRFVDQWCFRWRLFGWEKSHLQHRSWDCWSRISLEWRLMNRVLSTLGIVFLLSPSTTTVSLLWDLRLRMSCSSYEWHFRNITNNFLFANYHAVWPLDHDDGSCYYYDTYNVLVYGGFKNYLGHSKICILYCWTSTL